MSVFSIPLVVRERGAKVDALNPSFRFDMHTLHALVPYMKFKYLAIKL